MPVKRAADHILRTSRDVTPASGGGRAASRLPGLRHDRILPGRGHPGGTAVGRGPRPVAFASEALMRVLLLGIGVALIVFGAFVLLRHSDRPGGTLKWLGLEASSTGAGLPLIALGIGCVVFVAIREPGRSTRDGSAAAEPESSASGPRESLLGATGTQANPPFADSSACLRTLFASVPADRVGSVEAGTRDFDLIAPPQSLRPPFGIVFTDDGERVGAVRMRFYESGLFRVEAVVDAACRPVQALRNLSRGGDPRALQNWDTIRMRLGEHEYDLRLGGETTIRLAFSRVS